MIKVLVVSGGISSEHEVSLKSGQMVYDHLDRAKYIVEKAVIARNGEWTFSFVDGRFQLDEALSEIKKTDFDIAFLALHGEFGEDGQIQRHFDSIGLAYTGSDADSSQNAMDKAKSNEVFQKNGLLVPKYIVVEKNDRASAKKVDLPVMVKPLNGGSSIGISIVKNAEDLDKALDKAFETEDKAMVQQFVSGRELTCGVIDEKGKSRALPPTEIIPLTSDFWDFEAKYEKGKCREITPPDLSEDEIRKVQAIALLAHRILGCSGVTRTDMILADGKYHIIETNTIPGMTAMSVVPQEAEIAGISKSHLLDLIIEASLQ